MDVFRTLVGGGVQFDKQRFGGDIAIFDKNVSNQSNAIASTSQLPKGLDFFGDASLPVVKKGGKEKQREEIQLLDAEEVTRETLSAFLKRNKIKQTGTDVPLPITSWSQLESRYKVDKRLLTNMPSTGWKEPTAVQKSAIPAMLDARDVLVGAPTGSGKTLTYLLPILHLLEGPRKQGFRAIIVSPTQELSQQILQQLERLGAGRKWKFCVLSRSTEGVMQQDPQFKKKYDILITTPLRLVHAVEQNEVDLSNVRHLILDEADRLLEQGFLEQTDAILSACTHSTLRKALFSATMPAGIEELAKTFMYDEVRILVGTKDAAVESVEQELLFVSDEDGKLLGLRNLIREGKLKPPVLVFVQSIERAKDLFKELVYDDLHVDVIHSDRSKAQRQGVIEAFKRGDVWILICTEVLARGIDFKGVEVVVNYDFPQSRESYIHRIGRTARMGRNGKAITFFTRSDAPYLKSIANVMRQSGCKIPDWMTSLKTQSQKEKKQLKRKAPERQAIDTVAGSIAGRKQANQRREMIQASKKRRQEEQKSGGGNSSL